VQRVFAQNGGGCREVKDQYQAGEGRSARVQPGDLLFETVSRGASPGVAIGGSVRPCPELGRRRPRREVHRDVLGEAIRGRDE
jgi:hypothetical protein